MLNKYLLSEWPALGWVGRDKYQGPSVPPPSGWCHTSGLWNCVGRRGREGGLFECGDVASKQFHVNSRDPRLLPRPSQLCHDNRSSVPRFPRGPGASSLARVTSLQKFLRRACLR